eukprot:274987-Prymnesium_polylepis.1
MSRAQSCAAFPVHEIATKRARFCDASRSRRMAIAAEPRICPTAISEKISSITSRSKRWPGSRAARTSSALAASCTVQSAPNREVNARRRRMRLMRASSATSTWSPALNSGAGALTGRSGGASDSRRGRFTRNSVPVCSSDQGESSELRRSRPAGSPAVG